MYSCLVLVKKFTGIIAWLQQHIKNMTGKSGSNLDIINKWKLDPRVKNKLKGTFFNKISDLVLYKQRGDFQTFIQTCFDKSSRTFTFGKDRSIALYFGLEDVYYITGLPVDGKPVVCEDIPTADLCKRLLGASEVNPKKKMQINKKWLRAQFEVVPEHISEDQLNHYVRAYMLYLLVTTILPDCDNPDDIPAYWLQFIEDLNPKSLNNVAWGAAAHVMLITNLSRERNNVKGPYWILEVFFFERISMISKKYMELTNGTSARGSKKFPLHCYWLPLMVEPGMITAKSLKKNMETIRDQMEFDDIDWQPYAKYERYQRKRIFFSRVVLFNFDNILYHEPEKGAHQLNIINVENVREQKPLVIKSKRGYTDRNLLKKYADYIRMWHEERYLETSCIKDSSCAFTLPPSPEEIDDDLDPFITEDEYETNSASGFDDSHPSFFTEDEYETNFALGFDDSHPSFFTEDVAAMEILEVQHKSDSEKAAAVMGEEEANTEVGKTVANGTVSPTKPDNVVSEDTKDDEKDKNKEVNVDKEDAEISKDAKEGEEKEINDDKEEGKDKRKEQTESEAMEVDDEIGSKKLATKKGGVEKGNSKKATEEKKGKEKKEEPKTPVARTIDRPVRERKSVERLVAVIEKDTAREFHIEKGRGTALKDIPNVAYKLSKRKVADDALKLLHTVLFGRRGKALLVKSNILRFSGFVWHENEEKQKAKVQEKLDKYNKEKLFELCDLLDIPIAKTSAKKEDVVVKLIDFLLLPHITTSELLSEKEQPSKGSKRKKSASTSGVTPSKDSSKKQKSKSASEEREGTPETEGSEEEEEEEEKSNGHQKVNGGPEKSEHTESEGESESESESGEGEGGSKKHKRGGSTKLSSKKDSASKNKSKQKELSPQTQTQKKASASRSKSKDQRQSEVPTPKTKKKSHEVGEGKKPSTPKKSASKEKTGKKAVTEKEEKQKPSEDELKAAVCEILKQVDFNTVTFTDILKMLGTRFNTDLTPRKATIKLMIQDELKKLADVTDDDDEEEEGEADKTGKQASTTKA